MLFFADTKGTSGTSHGPYYRRLWLKVAPSTNHPVGSIRLVLRNTPLSQLFTVQLLPLVPFSNLIFPNFLASYVSNDKQSNFRVLPLTPATFPSVRHLEFSIGQSGLCSPQPRTWFTGRFTLQTLCSLLGQSAAVERSR